MTTSETSPSTRTAPDVTPDEGTSAHEGTRAHGEAASHAGSTARATGLGVRDVVVRYPAARRRAVAPAAVDGVSLDVARGEVLALLGPSGCGKSSLLRAVAGLEPLAGGDVTWDGASVADVPVHRRDFGLMFQDGQLFTHRDVAGNIAYGLAGRPRSEVAARVEHLLELVGLPGAGRRAVATLSGGERQRVALARALAPAPRLLLLDEPLSALDRSLRERLALDLRTALLATGTTALFVTHDQDEAFVVADRVAVMSAGRLLQVGTPAELWRAPADEHVARFLGYEAFVRAADAPTALRRAVPAPDDATYALPPGALVVAPPATAPADAAPADALPPDDAPSDAAVADAFPAAGASTGAGLADVAPTDTAPADVAPTDADSTDARLGHAAGRWGRTRVGDAELSGVVLAVRTRRGSPTLHVDVPGVGEVTVATPAAIAPAPAAPAGPVGPGPARSRLGSGAPTPGDEVALHVLREAVVVLPR